MNRRYFLDLAERVLATFIETYIAAVVLLPGDVWNSNNWKVAVGGAIAATVKSVLASRVGDKGTASLVPVAAAGGAAAGGAVGGAVGSSVGGVLGGIGDLLGGIFNKGAKND